MFNVYFTENMWWWQFRFDQQSAVQCQELLKMFMDAWFDCMADHNVFILQQSECFDIDSIQQQSSMTDSIYSFHNWSLIIAHIIENQKCDLNEFNIAENLMDLSKYNISISEDDHSYLINPLHPLLDSDKIYT